MCADEASAAASPDAIDAAIASTRRGQSSRNIRTISSRRPVSPPVCRSRAARSRMASGSATWLVSLAGASVSFDLALEFAGARRTDSVAELRVRTLGDVRLHSRPVLIVAANPLAVAADWQQPVQLFDIRERVLQFVDALGEPHLQRQHAD